MPIFFQEYSNIFQNSSCLTESFIVHTLVHITGYPYVTPNIDENPTKSFQIKATCDALRDLVPFVQFKKREKQPWRCLTFVKVTFFHGCFSRFVNCINATKSREKSYKWKFNALQRYCLSITPENTRKPLEFQGV